MDKTFGTDFLRPEGGKIPLDEICAAPLILAIFSASWCPPCQAFAPIIKKFYSDANQAFRRVEIIFISCDRTVKEFYEQFHTLNFPALPFNSNKIDDIEEAVEASDIPIVSIIDKNTGAVLHRDVCKLILEGGAKCYDKLLEMSSN